MTDHLPLFGDTLAGETQAQRATRRAEQERILKSAKRTAIAAVLTILAIGFIAGTAVAMVVDSLTTPKASRCVTVQPSPWTPT